MQFRNLGLSTSEFDVVHVDGPLATDGPVPEGFVPVSVTTTAGGRVYALGGFIEQNRNPDHDAFAYDVAAATGCEVAALDTTLVVISHDLELVEHLADQVVTLAGGRIADQHAELGLIPR